MIAGVVLENLPACYPECFPGALTLLPPFDPQRITFFSLFIEVPAAFEATGHPHFRQDIDSTLGIHDFLRPIAGSLLTSAGRGRRSGRTSVDRNFHEGEPSNAGRDTQSRTGCAGAVASLSGNGKTGHSWRLNAFRRPLRVLPAI